eukprot:7382528-Prymnesium_polylepis.3
MLLELGAHILAFGVRKPTELEPLGLGDLGARQPAVADLGDAPEYGDARALVTYERHGVVVKRADLVRREHHDIQHGRLAIVLGLPGADWYKCKGRCEVVVSDIDGRGFDLRAVGLAALELNRGHGLEHEVVLRKPRDQAWNVVFDADAECHPRLLSTGASKLRRWKGYGDTPVFEHLA